MKMIGVKKMAKKWRRNDGGGGENNLARNGISGESVKVASLSASMWRRQLRRRGQNSGGNGGNEESSASAK
jgi:hypothetical protein